MDNLQTEAPGVDAMDAEAIQKLPCAAALTDLEGIIVTANQLLVSLLPEVAAYESSSTDFVKILKEYRSATSQSDSSEAAIDGALQTPTSVRFFINCGRDRHLQITCYPSVLGEQNFRVWEVTDVGLDFQIQRHEAHTEKMQAISRLAGGMAHEFNNLLTAVLGNIELMRTDGEATVASVASRLESAEAAALRASHLIGELRRFSSRNVPRQEPQSIVPIVRESKRILAGMARNHVAVELSISGNEENLVANVNSDALSDALIKIGANALDSIGERMGTVQFELSTVQPAEGGQNLQICVFDSGDALSHSAMSMVFEPFSSTKQPTAVSGLGMAMAYSLIAEMGGTVEIDESVVDGTCVKVMFPVFKETGGRAAETAGEPPVIQSRSIALVDNEPGIRSVGQGMLKHLGQTVRCFSSGPALLSAIEAGDQFDLVILDNAMPGVSGRATFAGLRALNEVVPVIICSGRAVDLQSFAGDNFGPPNGFLSKPFSLSTLSSMLVSVE